MESEAVAFGDAVLADCAADVRVANVLPSKSEGTVGLGTFSLPLRLWDPLMVRIDRDCEALLCAVLRAASQSHDSIAPLMVIG